MYNLLFQAKNDFKKIGNSFLKMRYYVPFLMKGPFYCPYMCNNLLTSYLGRIGYCRPYLPERSIPIETFNLNTFLRERKKKQLNLSKGKCGNCYGCTFLLKGSPDIHGWEFNSIDLAFSSFCNLRCKYCFIDPEDLSKKDPEKEMKLFSFISEILDKGLLNPTGSVSFSGGEPTLMATFSKTCQIFSDYSNSLSYTFVTNCTIVAKDIVRLMKSPSNVALIISIDSGDAVSYQKIKGKDFFDTVFRNLKIYLDISHSFPNNVVKLKYIIFEENLDDIINFLDLLHELGYNEAYYDTDGRNSNVSEEIISAAIYFCIEAHKRGINPIPESTGLRLQEWKDRILAGFNSSLR